MHAHKKALIDKAFIYLLLSFLFLITVVPFYLMIINSTRTSSAINSGLSFLPGTMFLTNLKTVLVKINIFKGLYNSAFISISTTILSTYFSGLTAYGLVIYEFKGKKLALGVILATVILPQQLSLIGFYELMNKFGLIDTFIPLIIPSIASAFTVFFMMQYIKTILPLSLVEASRIDGASEITIFHKVAFPIMMPGLATMSLFTFVGSWNNYVGPLIILIDSEKLPLPVLIAQMTSSAYKTDFGALYLAISVSVIPILLLFAFFSKTLIAQVSLGAIKE